MPSTRVMGALCAAMVPLVLYHYTKQEVKAVQEEPVGTPAEDKTYATLEAAFTRVVGPDAINEIVATLKPVPVITIGGDQLTGKSTLAKSLGKMWAQSVVLCSEQGQCFVSLDQCST